MARRSKNGTSQHDRRNKFLRDRALTLERRNAWHETKEFGEHCAAVAKERNMRWFKNEKDIVSKSLRPWFAGEQNLYYWALDVVEIALIEIEDHMRRSVVSLVDDPARQHEAGIPPHLREPEPEPQTISSGTVAELDTLRAIAILFVPLKADARARIIHYLESLTNA